MILTNGRMYVLNAAGSVVDTLVVRGGRIVFAGRAVEVNAPVGEPSIDLRGRAVLPGLVDAHGHLMHLARRRFLLTARGASEPEVADLVGLRAAQTPRGDWILGAGWNHNAWPGGNWPTKASLDRVAPDHPVSLRRIDGHATWVNSAALRAAGIDRGTPDPYGGIIKRDRGEPTGVLVDNAQLVIERVEPIPTKDNFDQAVRDAIAKCLAVGLTGVHEMGAKSWALASYRRLIEEGQFPFRNYAAIDGRDGDLWTEYRDRGPQTFGDGRLTVAAVKLWADGALGSRGAALHDCYCDDPEDPDNTGLILIPPDEIERLTLEGLEHSFQVCVHAIGDRANTLTLDAFERALHRMPRLDHRLRIEHAQILADEDIPRFARLGVLPSMQATHCTSDMEWAINRLGPDRLRGAYPWRSLLATGAVIAGGSDFPVESPNPFRGIYAAVTRRPHSGEDRGWQPEQRMTREEAIRSFTTWNAYASRNEADLGSLEPGKRADLVALSDDVFTCSEDRIKDIRPVLTLVGGEIVFRADVT